MRAFIIKTMNLLFVCAVLAGYQWYAAKRDVQIADYEKKAAEAEQLRAEAAIETESPKETLYKDGIYQGEGTGFGGAIQVEIEMKDDRIISARILSAKRETKQYLEQAESLLQEVVSEQSADIDAVSGATLSSNGILEGIRNAWEQAKGE